MGGTKRQFSNLYIKFSQKFKKPFSSVLKVCMNNFTDKDFIIDFKTIYPHLWQELQSEYVFWKTKNDIVLKHGKKSRYDFPKPEDFILIKSIHLRQNARAKQQTELNIDKEQLKILKDELITDGAKKLAILNEKKRRKLELTQIVDPEFFSGMVNRYFNLNGKSQEIVDEKLDIIREAGNYKSLQNVTFLQKVNAKEQNFELKQIAIIMLQNMNEKVILRRKKMGGKTSYVEATPITSDSPDSLFEKLKEQMLHFEASKNFDVFISHNSIDKNKIIDFYKLVNLFGLHIYVDWVNDKYPLQRSLTNENTAKAILHRLSKSRMLICFISEASFLSQWMPWEIGYFHGLGKPVFVYNPDNIALPIFLQLYPNVVLSENELSVKIDNELIRLDTWLSTNVS